MPTFAGTLRPQALAETAFSTDPVGSLPLLTDPFLQAPSERDVHVVWFTEFAGSRHAALVGRGVDRLDARTLGAVATGRVRLPGITRVTASTTKLSRSAEDSASNVPADRRPAADAGIVARDVWRHEASVNGLRAGERVPYRS
ncbi:hypothetical protein MXD63_25880 [Frankia sp. Cpl3]|nr:hypothetical protein [Frankia sp. Cpl3]